MLNGQMCTASARLLLQSTIAEDFTRKLKDIFEKTAEMAGCDPIDPSSAIVPVADTKQLQHVLQGLEIGNKNARLLTGVGRKGTNGRYVQPTIFVDVDEDSQL